MTQPPGTGGLINAIRRQWIRNWRVTLAFALGLILSVVSFFTTLEGLVAFTAPDASTRSWPAWLLAAGATLGIQLVLLLSAWMVGTAAVRAFQPHKSLPSRLGSLGSASAWMLMFVLTLSTSVFFSYHTFYSRISAYYAPEQAPASAPSGETNTSGRSQSRAGTRSPHIESLARLHVRTTIEPLLHEMQVAAEKRRRWYLDAFSRPEAQLSDGARRVYDETDDYKTAYQAWTGYLERMRRLADDAKALVPAVRSLDQVQEDARRQAEEQRRNTEAQRTVALERAGQASTAAEEEVRRLDQEIRRVDATLADEQKSIRPHEAKRDVAKETMNCEEQGSSICRGASGKSGRGPRYNAAKRDYDAARLIIADKQRKIDEAKADLARLRAAQAAAEKVIAEAKGTTTRLQPASDASSAAEEIRPITAPELEKLVDGMYRALDSLTEPATFAEGRSGARGLDEDSGSATLESLKEGCVTIHSRVLIPELVPHFKASGVHQVAEGAQEIKCDRSGFEEAVSRVQGLNAGLRQFAEYGCASLGGKLAGAETATIIRHAEDCLGLLELEPSFSNEIVETLSELGRNHSLAVHPFIPSLLGLRVYNDYLAWLSLGIAVMIDGLVFFAGIVGGHENLRRIDRVGEELRGDDALVLGLASLRDERPTDSEKIRYWRRLLRHFVLRELSPVAAAAAGYPRRSGGWQRVRRWIGWPVKERVVRSHIRYIGYIAEDQLLARPDGGESLLGTLQVWMCTPKSNVDLILRVPRDDDELAATKPDPFDPLPDTDDDPVRFYFLRELVLDIAEDIIHWDRAHARYGDGAVPEFGFVHGHAATRRSKRSRKRKEPRLTPADNHVDPTSSHSGNGVSAEDTDPNRRIHVSRPSEHL